MRGDWQKTNLREACISVSYGYTESAREEEVGPHFLRITDIQGGVVNWNNVPYCPIEEKHHNKYRLLAGDIVIARTGNSTGENYLFRGMKDSVFASYLIKFSVDKSKFDPAFVWYNLRSPSWWHFVNGFKTGSAQAGANAKTLGMFEFKYPPLPTQKAIAHILGILDDKIELNRQMNETLETMAQALFKSWFVDFDPVLDKALAAGHEIPEPLQQRALKRQQVPDDKKLIHTNPELVKDFPARFVFTEALGWIPEGWEVVSFGDVSECFDRLRIPLSAREREKKKPGIYPYYGATSINDYIDEYIFDDTYLLLGEDGSVIDELGKPYTQYVWGKIWVNNHAHVLQGRNGISTEHLLTFIRDQNIKAYVTGAVQMKLNQKNMKSIPFLKADSRVIQAFDGFLKKLYKKHKSIFEQNQTLTKTRDTLLPKLISGELAVPAAEQLIADHA